MGKLTATNPGKSFQWNSFKPKQQQGSCTDQVQLMKPIKQGCYFILNSLCFHPPKLLVFFFAPMAQRSLSRFYSGDQAMLMIT